MTRVSNSKNNSNTIKFLYSYGGKILPRWTDGKLRYVDGYTRILAVDRSITFAELMVKFGELCGSSMTLKCKLPNEDLDVLISITCDEDLANIMEEYDQFSSYTHQDMKIRAILFPLKSLKKISPPVSAVSSVDISLSKSSPYAAAATVAYPCQGRDYYSPVGGIPVGFQMNGGKVRCYPRREQRSPSYLYLFPDRQ